MEHNLAAASPSHVAVRSRRPGIGRARWTTACLCGSFVAAGVAVNSIRLLQTYTFASVKAFIGAQVDVLGLLGIALAVITLVFGVSYARGIAERLGADASQVRAAHMTLAASTLATVALHVLAIAAGSSFTVSATRLLVPFVWPQRGGFPYPLAAGIIGLWVVALFGLSYFARRRLRGHDRWRRLHHVVLIGVALGLVHTVFLIGWFPGWGLG